MNRQELVKAVSETTGHSQAAVSEVLNGIIASVQNAVAKGDKVALVGFGTFGVSERAARTGRNPSTGEEIKIPASKSPKFTAGKSFKDAVNS